MVKKAFWIFFLFCSSFCLGQVDSIALRHLLERHSQAHGGSRALFSLTSLSIEGTQEQGGETFNFLLRKKRPDAIRFRLAGPIASVTCAYDGNTGWQRIETAEGASVETLSDEQVQLLREEGRFDSPLIRFLTQRLIEIDWLRYDVVEGVQAHVLEVRERGRPTLHYWLDTQTTYVLRRSILNEAGEVVFTTDYADYRVVEGYPFAFESANRVGDQTVSLNRITKVDINPGLLSIFFQKPRS